MSDISHFEAPELSSCLRQALAELPASEPGKLVGLKIHLTSDDPWSLHPDFESPYLLQLDRGYENLDLAELPPATRRPAGFLLAAVLDSPTLLRDLSQHAFLRANEDHVRNAWLYLTAPGIILEDIETGQLSAAPFPASSSHAAILKHGYLSDIAARLRMSRDAALSVTPR